MTPDQPPAAGGPRRRPFLLALGSALPLVVWWAGFYPGFLSSDSIDQLTQAKEFSFTNFHPAFHSLYLWLLTPFGDSPGAVSLFQALALAVLLAVGAHRLTRLGVPDRLAVGTAWVIALLPAVGPTTIAIWKDVPFSLSLLWAFVELLDLARDPARFWGQRGGPLRLGAALAGVWLFRPNGFITVVLLLVVLAAGFRARLRRVGVVAAVVAVAVVAVTAILYRILPVDTSSIEPSAVLTSDVAASLRWEPGNFSPAELDYLAAIAPLAIWTGRYDCHDSTPLSFDPQFDSAVMRADPGPFRALAIRTLVRDLDTVAGNRWCAASYLFSPHQPATSYFHRPPYDIWPNDLGLERRPLVNAAFRVTDRIFRWAEGPLWLTWRPALAVWAAGLTYLAIGSRIRRLLWPGAIILVHLANVVITTPAQEFRYAFGIYLMALLSVPLAWLAVFPSQATLLGGEPQGRA